MSGYCGFLIRLAREICDADQSLEDMKHGHRCRRQGCLDGHYTLCMAWRQANAAARYFRETALPRPPALPTHDPGPEPAAADIFPIQIGRAHV